MKWNRPSDFLTFQCRRNFALAFAAVPAFAVAAAFVAAAAASRHGVAAFFRAAAAVTQLVAAAGFPLSDSAVVKVSAIVIMKVVAGVVAVGAGLIGTSAQM